MTRPLRIAMVTTEYPPFIFGGLGTHVQELVAGLQPYGFQIDIFSRADGPCADAVDHGARVHYIPAITFEGGGSAEVAANLRQASVSAAAAAELHYGACNGPDLIHCHGFLAYQAGALIKKRYSSPVLTTIHSIEVLFHQRWGLIPPPSIVECETAMMRGSDHFIAVSRSTSEDAQSSYAIDPRQITIIYNGIDSAALAALVPSPAERETLRTEYLRHHELAIVFAGRVMPQKGVSALIRSAIKVLQAAPHAKYFIAGPDDNDYARNIRAIAENHPRRDSIRFLGKLSRKALASLYSIADMAIVPSIYESFGFAAVEPMSLGVPVIASDIGGLREIIQDSVTGLLVKVRENEGLWNVDVPALAAAQLRLLGDANYRAVLGRAGRASVRSRFPLNAMIPTVVELYSALVERRLYTPPAMAHNCA